VLAVALAALVAMGGGVAADRLRTPSGDAGTFAVQAIAPDYEVAAESAAPKRVAPKPKPKRVATATAARSVSCPAMPPVASSSATAARAVKPRVRVYDRPEGSVTRTLTNPTIEGQPLHALVHEQRGLWLRIQLVARPNGSTGWVKIVDFARYQAPYRIVVQRCAKRLTVFNAGKAVWSRTVAVGKPATPTPKGSFFVDFVTAMPCCSYGPYMLSVAGFSEVLQRFGKDGIGQIAIHGTNASWSIGKASSNGCVRMHNADVTALARLVPAGTPVTIVD